MTVLDRRPAVDAARFAVELRRECAKRQLPASIGAAIDLVAALSALPERDAVSLYYASRSLFVHRLEERPAFDAAFSSVLDLSGDAMASEEPAEALDLEDAPEGPGEDESSSADAEHGAYSPVEVLQHRDLATLSPEELDLVADLVSRLDLAAIYRRRLRTGASKHSSDVIDLRRSLRGLRDPEGDPVVPHYRRRLLRPRRLVVLLDISGSMTPYVSVLCRLVYRLAATGLASEVFTLGTRLTRVTRTLASHDERAAISELSRFVLDWSGGTRLGESIERFNRIYGIRGLARQATVVIFSDGLDRGDPALLGGEMHRLRQVADRVIWVNPLKGATGYAPLARGMQAALPSVDHLVAGHSFDAFVELLSLIASR